MLRRYATKSRALAASTQLLLLLGFGCQLKSSNVVFASDVQIPRPLKTRVLEYWQARINHDFDTTYALEFPELKKTFKMQDYKAQFGPDVVHQRVEVTELTTQGDETQVKLKVYFRLNAPVPGVAGKEEYAWIRDYWKQVDGKWYHVLKDWVPKERQ